MKIEKMSYEILSLPLKTPFKTALRTAYDVSFVRVCIATQNGVEGFGEAPATKAVTGEGLEEIVASIEKVRGDLIGAAPQEAFEILRCAPIGSSAKAALDMACVSLEVAQRNTTLGEYFALGDRTPMETAITISYNAQETMVQHAKKAYAEGMGILKLKFAEDVAHAIETTRAIASALPHAKLLIDPNQAWSVEGSLRYLEAIGEGTVAMLEQPLKADAVAGLKTLKEASSVPIVADESVFTLEDAKRVMGSKSADMFNIKLMKCGGVTRAIELLEYARQERIGVMLGSMLEGPISINYALYLAFAYRDVIRFLDLDSPLLLAHMPKEIDFIYEGSRITPLV
jgi:L-alanine-DL-glutamate epimerase-like enolase superfamily enzyme